MVQVMIGDRQALRRGLWRLAGRQHGYFTAAQAVKVGYSHQAQKFNVDHGNWVRVDRGLFRLPEWQVANDDHFVRWSLWSGGAAVVSHTSALAMHDLGDVDPARIHLSVPRGFRRSTPHAVVLHRQDVPDSDTEDRGGYRVTTPTRAIVESAADRIEQEWLDTAVAEALDRGLTTRRMLRDAAVRTGAVAEVGVERALSAAQR